MEHNAVDPGGAPPTDPVPRAIRVTLIVLPVLFVAALGIIGLRFAGAGNSGNTGPGPISNGPIALPSVPAAEATSSACMRLLAALPQELLSHGEKLPRREIRAPAPAGAVAWGGQQREPLVLRCGLGRPQELTATSQLREISGVRWLEIPGAAASSWVAVDRAVYVVLTVPSDSGTGPLQDVSAAIRQSLPSNNR